MGPVVIVDVLPSGEGASAGAFTRVGGDTDPAWLALAAFATGAGLGFVGAPTMGSLYRTLPGHLVPQGSSVLYMLNQIGASIGIAVVAVIVDIAGRDDPMRGFHGVSWWLVATALVILAGSTLLPGHPGRTPATLLPADQPDSASEAAGQATNATRDPGTSNAIA